MRRSISLATVCLLLFATTPWPAMATSGAHFFTATGTVQSDGSLLVSWDEAGVGQATVDYTLTVATATAKYGCINGGSNHPKAANKETFQSTITGGGSFTPNNGRVQGALTVGPVSAPSTFSCPPGQTAFLLTVSYSGITLTDTTNNVSTLIANTGTVTVNAF